MTGIATATGYLTHALMEQQNARRELEQALHALEYGPATDSTVRWGLAIRRRLEDLERELTEYQNAVEDSA